MNAELLFGGHDGQLQHLRRSTPIRLSRETQAT